MPGPAAPQDLRARLAELERDAMLDPLTGAWTRRWLDHTMGSEIGRSRRYRQPLSAMLLDIDHFKAVNDRLGHHAGDAVLRELVAVARGGMRDADTVARWGGEEFLLLLPSTPHGAAAAAAEKLRHAIEAHAFPGAGRVTVSVGVAEALPGEESENLFRRLDEALYRAKSKGRNRVEADACGASDTWLAHGVVVQLVWQESFRCGEPTIDAQHEQLFRLANELIAAAVAGGAASLEFVVALERCLAHIARHFEDEERILAAAGYEQLADHRSAHRKLLAQAEALRARALAGKAGVGALVEFLAYEVVSRHLLKGDRDYFPLFSR